MNQCKATSGSELAWNGLAAASGKAIEIRAYQIFSDLVMLAAFGVAREDKVNIDWVVCIWIRFQEGSASSSPAKHAQAEGRQVDVVQFLDSGITEETSTRNTATLEKGGEESCRVKIICVWAEMLKPAGRGPHVEIQVYKAEAFLGGSASHLAALEIVPSK
ncbi:hypothetical protein FB451DRAFT_1170297 [Mycena latifolia]|nr:hypothetical protein FB451DRAFT_1170297 [Mycena latifolia]